MICVYPADCTDFSNNGMGAVSPSSCTVTETLNGEWELTLVHSLDAHDKWRKLTDGNILRVPVPAAMTPHNTPWHPRAHKRRFAIASLMFARKHTSSAFVLAS